MRNEKSRPLFRMDYVSGKLSVRTDVLNLIRGARKITPAACYEAMRGSQCRENNGSGSPRGKVSGALGFPVSRV